MGALKEWEKEKAMSAATKTRSNHDIRAAVQNELERIPEVDAAGIASRVDTGVVALSGEAERFAEGTAAKRAALSVREVTAVIDDRTVHPEPNEQAEQAAWASAHVGEVERLLIVRAH